LSSQGVASPSLPNYGGVGLDHVGGHARAPTKSREPEVHDGGGARGMPHARGLRIPYASGRIHCDMHVVLRVRV
jgi:hypothetical protein